MRVLSPWTENLHTSKRMHFIEDPWPATFVTLLGTCIRQNVCTSLRSEMERAGESPFDACIRQNVCTSLRNGANALGNPRV